MTTQYDPQSSTDPGSRSSAQLEGEVRRSRAQVEDTLEAIQDRLSPGQLVDRVAHYLRDNGGEFARNFGQVVRRNPVPAALVGVGLVWMMLSSRRHDGLSRAADMTPDEAFDPDWPEVGSGAESFGSEADEDTGEGLSEAAGRSWQAAKEAGTRLGRFAGGARERAAGMGAGMAQRARRTGAQARYYRGRAREGFLQTLQRQPLVLGALGLAAGAVLGAALPPTRREDELMGDTSDDLKQRAWAAGREGYARAEAAAGAAYTAAGEEAKEQGLSREGIESAADAVRHKFENVAEAATEAARREAGLQDRADDEPTP
jgi:Protein of unknown function (DUF3618)